MIFFPVPASNLHQLDFWVGSWEVYVGDEKAGDDVVEASLGGHAITERWKGAGGDEGMSLFYFRTHEDNWKQVWVTPTPQYKEKVSHGVKGGIQFVGHVFLKSGKMIDDRTTLTRLPGDRVLQFIEDKIDGKWKTMFKAVYRRKR
ncbi:MAG TPA: hypothetical protein VG944_13620 [Fimbriimonas sp.]|nr:hypothetical protein [Fimbriimonas sp.]